MISQGPCSSSSSRRPPLLHHYQTVQHSCCCTHSATHSTAPLIPSMCNWQKQVANFMFHHLMPLKGSLVTINKGLSGPQIQSTHFAENFQASPGAQSWNLTYSLQTYFPILHYLQMSTLTNPEVSTTEADRSNMPLSTLLRKITVVYPVNYKIFIYVQL